MDHISQHHCVHYVNWSEELLYQDKTFTLLTINFGCAGDDCIGILEGTSNLYIEQVTCGPGHGIRCNSLTKFSIRSDYRTIQFTVSRHICTLQRIYDIIMQCGKPWQISIL